MKKIVFVFMSLIFSFNLFSQTKGITYQAVIYDPQSADQSLPGIKSSPLPYANKSICMKFEIVDINAGKVYVETQSTSTDAYGMVNLIIGLGKQIGGSVSSFANIKWDGKISGLVVSIATDNFCSNFTQVSSQPFTATPFSMGSASEADGVIAASRLVGTDISTVGTINTGVWNASAIDIAHGGTGASNAATALANLGGESSSNKSADLNLGSTNASDALYPTQKAVKSYVDKQMESKALDATANQKGQISLSGDLAGTASSPQVVRIQSYPISSIAPTADQVLKFNGTTWEPSTINTSSSSSSNVANEMIDYFTANGPTTTFKLYFSAVAKPKLFINGVLITEQAISYSANNLVYNAAKNDNYSLESGDKITIEYLFK
mgnify:FL=1